MVGVAFPKRCFVGVDPSQQLPWTWVEKVRGLGGPSVAPSPSCELTSLTTSNYDPSSVHTHATWPPLAIPSHPLSRSSRAQGLSRLLYLHLHPQPPWLHRLSEEFHCRLCGCRDACRPPPPPNLHDPPLQYKHRPLPTLSPPPI
jgi:hypothetical protein